MADTLKKYAPNKMKPIINVNTDETLLEIRGWLLGGGTLKSALKMVTNPTQLAKIKAESPHLTTWGSGTNAIIQRMGTELCRRYDRHSYVSVAKMILQDERLKELAIKKLNKELEI